MSERRGSEPANSAPDVYSDRVKTHLQTAGEVSLTDGATLGELLGLVRSLGIDPQDVVLHRGGLRQIRLRVVASRG